ncbi:MULTISPECIES: carbon-nitrogen hydrolase family protein [Lonsdalea]|uniref:Nitrilase n=2 Tax=Lonsdalea TaxID=1082702 RepID=A0ACD1JFI0_9GAMM|nr:MULTISPECIES: carbon-nitrogen hydrolase family protein [Lonsdalea]OSM97077.1 nitrilase [Lonsdalea populi]OSN01496.1 nitrilase [Lonsdalea populi]QPQ22826.1 carbon-nitrogen hydrolase family protein [Lonsdalea populi]RAT14099.1 nitrilase [Lonsdalea quercina]RAT18025.1 nitrilase [Lonsdalea quercina]
MAKSVVAALQLGSSPAGKAATLAEILAYEDEIARSGCALVVMPEALLGGYPKGEIFGTYLGYRLPEGREAYERYYHNAIDFNGEECEALAGLSARTGASLVVGAIERDGNTLYCSALFFTPEDGLVGKHRKLMPTGTERLIWGQGDGSTLTVVNTQAGKVGAAICWENHMPALRMAMYGKGVEIWCAPTVDERENWQASMRHIAHEGRCFVITACQIQASPAELGISITGWDNNRPLINGGSLIVDPMGNVLAGPLTGEKGLLTAEIDTDELVKARYDLDVTGHYARPDVFTLTVDETPRSAVRYKNAAGDIKTS